MLHQCVCDVGWLCVPRDAASVCVTLAAVCAMQWAQQRGAGAAQEGDDGGCREPWQTEGAEAAAAGGGPEEGGGGDCNCSLT